MDGQMDEWWLHVLSRSVRSHGVLEFEMKHCICEWRKTGDRRMGIVAYTKSTEIVEMACVDGSRKEKLNGV